MALFAVMFGLEGLNVEAAKLTLQWGPSPDSSVVGYRVYVKQLPFGKTNVVEASGVSAEMGNLRDGAIYSIFITAYNEAGLESDPSDQVTYAVPIDGFSLRFDGF